jgi:hypothetical protein
MKDRNNTLVSIRNETIGFISNESSLEELFQNRTLRPILKFQNDLFLNIFINYAVKQKKVFFILSPEKKLHYIENVIQRDIKFRNLLKGTIIALFTEQEYQDYTKNSSNLNKRMMNLLIERLKSQVQLLEV